MTLGHHHEPSYRANHLANVKESFSSLVNTARFVSFNYIWGIIRYSISRSTEDRQSSGHERESWPSLPSHTLPQLPLSLTSLQLQSSDGIAEALLLLPHPLHLHLLQTRGATVAQSSGGRRATSPSRAWACGIRQPAPLQLGFGHEGLLAAGKLVEMRLDALEEAVELGLDGGEEGSLGRLECGFGDQLEMLRCPSERGSRGDVTREDVVSAKNVRRLTLVVCSTLVRRGKSLTPASRMSMLESRSCMLVCSERTQLRSAV